MEATSYYKDNYNRRFVNDIDFLSFLQNREENGRWKRESSSEIQMVALEKGSALTEQLISDYGALGKSGVIEDTVTNTSLILKVNDKEYPVRSCAIKTILDRARISGNALQKVKKPVLAEILNHCLKVAKGEALLRISEDKISAVHGGDNNEYAILEIPALFTRTTAYLNANFSGCTFAGGFYDHSLVSAAWELTGHSDLVKTYKEALEAHKLPVNEMQPALRLSTSDVGISGANLYPTLLMGKDQKTISLGSPLRLEHKADATLEKFESQLALIFSQYTQAIKNLADLLKIEVRNPVNCMAGVMKRIGIPKKLAFSAIDLFKAQNGEDDCTAHDIYFGICEVIFIQQCDGASGTQLAKIEEDVARALSVRWHDYDYPGELKW